jgi:hypothetical protein
MGGQWERTKLLIIDGENLGKSEEINEKLEFIKK